MRLLELDKRTLPQGENFKKADPEIRQVIDFNIEFLVREYQAEVLTGADGMRLVAPFPAHITKAIEYEPSVKSLAVYMSQYQLIPYTRVQEVFKDHVDICLKSKLRSASVGNVWSRLSCKAPLSLSLCD